MRIWSVHPKYLDTKGLVALWRETLLAKHVLEGKTKGYRNHPQLDRFKQTDYPQQRINQYLVTVYEEALERGYNFDKEKINWHFETSVMPVTCGQVKYEITHLLNKLKVRDPEKFAMLQEQTIVEPHPMFEIIEGAVEAWEII
ncbi:pyrimidine dimer DNA glycosylase/endonuclease V [Pseudopedobacter beijingensis]|uniref:Pyrimidine dimer DNA glycosylase/endonuclease V n=1 Tax=Pseudopedobacter beijingensis TaxID=1207056 RepID=A0ABW4I7H3_9SPHI